MITDSIMITDITIQILLRGLTIILAVITEAVTVAGIVAGIVVEVEIAEAAEISRPYRDQKKSCTLHCE
jgi:hypothetical protein